MRLLLAALFIALISATAGYWLGFKQAWQMSLMVDYAPRGVIAIGNSRLLDTQRNSELRAQMERDIDLGLKLWYSVDRSPLRSALNTLTGSDVIPSYERYIRKLAVYRKANPSPLADPTHIAEMLKQVGDEDPALAAEIVEGNRQGELAIQEVIKKYAP